MSESYFVGQGGSLTVKTSGDSRVVTITGLAAYSDAARTSAVTFPDAITAGKTYYFASNGSATVSVANLAGQELAGGTYGFSGGSSMTIDPAETVAQAVDSAVASAGIPMQNFHYFAFSTANVYPAANRCYYYRITHGQSGVVSGVKVGIQTGDASGHIAAAVYRNTGSGVSAAPGARLATSGSTTIGAGVGDLTLTLDTPVQVNVGDWVAVASDSTVVRVYGLAPSNNAAGLVGYQDSAFPPPATPSVTAGGSRAIPLLLVP